MSTLDTLAVTPAPPVPGDHHDGAGGEPPGDRSPRPVDGRGRRRPRRRRRLRRWLRWTALTGVVLLAPVGWSYARALAYPGSSPWPVRSVDWLREHHAGGLVDQVESWVYTRHVPPSTGIPRGPLPPRPTAAQARVVRAARHAGWLPVLRPGVAPRLPGEAQRRPGPLGPEGRPATYTAWFRPDPMHPSLVAGALWMNPRSVSLHLEAGTKEPGGGPWPGSAEVSGPARSRTIAAFNSGFLLRDSHGGFFEAGRTRGRLVEGRASLVFDRAGRATVGAWGRDVRMGRNVYAVRQNLDLIVDRGRPVPGLDRNTTRRWGSRRSQMQYTWRSGIGVDRTGHLVYVAGKDFALTTIADALVQAGAVRAMQLDTHTPMVTANLFKLGPGSREAVPEKLLPTMYRPADRYLHPDQRDFVTVELRRRPAHRRSIR